MRNKRIVKGLFITIAVPVAVAFAICSVMGKVQIAGMTPGNTPVIEVAGDSTTYSLYNTLLPSPTHDSTWAVTFNNSAFDSLAYTSYYDTVTFNVGPCNEIGLYGRWDADSLWYWVDYTIDWVTWTNWIDSTLVDAAVSRSYPPVESDWAQHLWRQLEHWTAGVEPDTIFDKFMWQGLRIRMRNGDRMAVNAGDTVLVSSAEGDTAINVQWELFCK